MIHLVPEMEEGSTLKMYVTLSRWQLANEEAAVVKSGTKEVICYPFQP